MKLEDAVLSRYSNLDDGATKRVIGLLLVDGFGFKLVDKVTRGRNLINSKEIATIRRFMYSCVIRMLEVVDVDSSGLVGYYTFLDNDSVVMPVIVDFFMLGVSDADVAYDKTVFRDEDFDNDVNEFIECLVWMILGGISISSNGA